jgi:hypothetical protein
VRRAAGPARELLLGLALAGCGATARPPLDGAGAPPDAAIAADATAAPGDRATDVLGRDDFITDYCGRLGPCCAAIARPSDGAACRSLAATMTAGFQPELAEACLTSLRLSAAPCTGALPPACTRVFSGVVASRQLGATCTSNEECLLSSLGPVTCAGAGQTAGHCQVVVRGHAGDAPCVGTADGPLTVPARDPAAGPKGYLCATADGVWCDDEAKACARSKGAGAACTTFGECGSTFTCDDGTGTCVVRKHQGDACMVDEECPSTICGEDNKCAPPPAIGEAVGRLCGMP